MAAELKNIYNAGTAELAAKRLEDFEQGPWERGSQPSLNAGTESGTK